MSHGQYGLSLIYYIQIVYVLAFDAASLCFEEYGYLNVVTIFCIQTYKLTKKKAVSRVPVPAL